MTSPARPAEIPAYLGNDEFLRGFYTHVSSEARSRQDPSTGLIPPRGRPTCSASLSSTRTTT